MEIILLILVISIIIFFIYRPLKINDNNDNSSNIAIGKQKLFELQNDLDQNFITQENYIQAKIEIEQNLANELNDNDDKSRLKNSPHIWAISIAIFIIVASSIIYSQVKSEKVALPKTNIEILINNVENNLQDSKSWQMLGLAYSLDNKLEKAKNSYEKSYVLGNRDVNLLAEYASVLAAIANGDFAGRPAKLIKEALEVDKTSIKALYLAGIIAANKNLFDLAKELWQQALSFSQKGGEDEKSLVEILNKLNEFTNNSKIEINVVIEINEELYKQYFNDFIMVYAKNATGRPMPIAIEKIPLKDFNGIVNLNNSNSIIPTMQLSDAQDIIIVARLSKTGGAIKQKDDIEVKSSIIKNGNQTVELSF